MVVSGKYGESEKVNLHILTLHQHKSVCSMSFSSCEQSLAEIKTEGPLGSEYVFNWPPLAAREIA
jgi:hypothetical protein